MISSFKLGSGGNAYGFDYDGNGNITSIRDPKTKETAFEYDGFDRLRRITDATGNYTTIGREDFGNTLNLSYYDKNNQLLRQTSTRRDAIGRTISLRENDLETGENVSYSYSYLAIPEGGQEITVKDGKNREFKTFLNAEGKTTKEIDYLGNISEYRYDGHDNVSEVLEKLKTAEGSFEEHKIFYYYNAFNKVEKIVQDPGTAEERVYTFMYDGRGNLSGSLDAEGYTTAIIYDKHGRKKSESRYRINEAPATTEFLYYENDRLKMVRDGNGNETNYEYDEQNRLQKIIFPDATFIQYTYDHNGNITNEKQRNGTSVNNTYDDLNRLISRSIQRATGVEDTTEESYGYDGLSRLIKAQDNDALVNLKYTSLGRIKEETQNGKNILYTYTKDGLRNSIKYPNGRIIAREFDDLNRLTAVKEENKNIVDFNFIGSALSANSGVYAISNLYNLGRSGSRLLNKKFANGDIVTYGYDQAKRLNHSETKNKNNEIINDYVYGYNKLDLKSFEKRNHENGQGDVYTYDELKRLIGVKYDSPEPENQGTDQFAKSREYALDRVDNITKMVDKQNNETNETLIEKAGNGFKLNQYSKFGNVVLEYDQNGNMTRKGNQRFYYNYRNQLVRISEGEMEIGYKYDALGRRIERAKGTNMEKYYYCDNQVIEERDGADQLLKQYVYGNGIDEAIQLKIVNGANAGDYYYHANGIGSTTAITDSNGVLIERVKYDVYGTPMFTDAAGQPLAGNQSAISNTVLFQGREYDQDAGLYYFRARYYDPALGRFMQTDPLGYWDSMNLYQSLNQNPVNFIDPNGLIIGYKCKHDEKVFKKALDILKMTTLGLFLYNKLEDDSRIFYLIDNNNPKTSEGGGSFVVENVTKDKKDFTEADIFINYKNIKNFSDATISVNYDLDTGYRVPQDIIDIANKNNINLEKFLSFKGLEDADQVAAEMLGHEFSHAFEAIKDPEKAVKRKMTIDDYIRKRNNCPGFRIPKNCTECKNYNEMKSTDINIEEAKVAYPNERIIYEELLKLIEQKRI